MSDYESSSQATQNENKNENYFKVFQHDHYISGSLHLIEDWKQNVKQSMTKQTDSDSTQVDPFKYMELQEFIFGKQQNFLLAAYHIRYYAFAFYVNKGLKNLLSEYKNVYMEQNFDGTKIQKLDQTVLKLNFYLQKIELSRATSYIQQIDSEIINQIYQTLQLIFPMIQNPYCIWRVVMFLQVMHEEQQFYVMNIPVNLGLQYYLKTFKTLKFRNEFLTNLSTSINVLVQKHQYLDAYNLAVKQLCLHQKKIKGSEKQQENTIHEQLQCQFLCCLKYMHFITYQNYKPEKDLYIQYIMSSLKVPYYGKNQNMPTEYYQKLFLRVLNQFKNDPRLIDLGLYIDLNVVGQRSSESFGKIQEVVLRLCQQLRSAQQQYLNNKANPKHEYIKKLLKDQQFTLLIQFMQTVMEFNKSSFLKADNQIYQIFLDMAQFLKNVFLSFGKNLWLFPQNVFSPLTLGFFKKISEDINDDLKNILYEMVQNLNANKMPQKLVFKNNQFQIVEVSRLQYLSAIMYYIEDCSRSQQYLNLPEIAPANFQSSVLLVKSLHVKFKHHEPNPTQLPLFVEYLKQCQKYKLNINFKWYKSEGHFAKSSQRETQFQIQSNLPCKQIAQLFRKCLNYRDKQYARKLIQEDYNKNHLISTIQLASMLKYNHGLQDLPNIQNVRQEQIFLMLQQMNTMLAILPDELFILPLEEEITVNYLHILLTFYCSKIQSAKGSQIYLMILQKVLINYLKSPFQKSKNFKNKYPKFFQKFIYQYHQIQICATLNQLIMEFIEKYYPFSKNQQEWSNQQKYSVNDFKEKIQIIRDEFLDKLQGSEQEIQMFMVTFTSLIDQNLPFKIFLECIRLFVKLINKKPSLKDVANLNALITTQSYKQPKFLSNMLSYLENYLSQDSIQKKQVKCSLIRHLLQSSQILGLITFKQLMDLLSYANKVLDVRQSVDDFQGIYQSMNEIVSTTPQKIRSQWILPYIVLFYRQEIQNHSFFQIFDEQKQVKEKIKQQKIKNVLNIFKTFQSDPQFWNRVRKDLKDFKFKDYYFIFEFSDIVKIALQEKKQVLTFKDVWFSFLKHLNDPSWTFYYMLKFNYPSLINIHENRNDVLINLIKKEKLTKQSYPIFKNMISQTQNMPFILQKIMEQYDKQENYIQNYQFHNKLILINERFPDQKIEQKIIKWIQFGQNKLPLRIPQTYYINFVKKQLKALPQHLGYESILKLHKEPENLAKVNKLSQKVFEVLLYFPIKKFQSISLSKINEKKQNQTMKQVKSEQKIQGQVDAQGQDEGEWQEQDENQEVEIKKTQGFKQERKKSIDNQSENEKEEELAQNNNQENNSNDQENNYYDSERPDILQLFYQELKKDQLNSYKQFCRIREQIDIYLKSDYKKLTNSPITDNQYLNQKLLQLLKQLESLSQNIQKSILIYLPESLYQALKTLGYKLEREVDKIQKLRKSKKKIFRIQRQLFSDRGESDDYDEDNGDNQYSSDDEQQSYEDDDNYDSDDESSQQQNQQNAPHSKKKLQNRQEIQQQIQQLPQLTSQFSKVQSEIKGFQLERRELMKVLQVFLVQIFKLTPINFKKKQIVFSYVQIMESDLGQIFFESILTLLRMDQNHKKNRKIILQQLKSQLLKNQSPYKVQQLSGLAEFSKYNGLVNLTHLLKILKDKQSQNDKTNPFQKQSGVLLPIAQKFIIDFDLPLQTNMFSLVLLYIHSKPKTRQLLEEISVGYGQNHVKMTKKQIKRIGQAFLKEKTHSSVWQYIQETLNYEVKDTDRLIISLDSYSQEVFKSLSSSDSRVNETIQKNRKSFENKINSQTQIKSGNSNHLKHYQRLYYITSNLLASCSMQIKQFYYMNKNICRYLWQDDDQNQDNYNYNKVPKKLLKCKADIYTNQSFIVLLQLAFRVIYFVKKQLYGKISSKKFNRLIHYPKLLIETATLYMHLSGQKGTRDKWEFKSKDMVEKFIENYQMGQYKFKNLVEVYNLIFGLLEIQSFCAGKFKELLIPYFTKNREIGIQAPLMFKVPEISDDVNGQNIFVTRECSFDMALYQVNGEGLFVQFHEEQGSDHGGMIRQLMMGWKGVGFGEQDFFIGKILGISFRQTVPYGGYVDLEMCIKITDFKITLENIQQIDKQVYNSLKFVKQNDPKDLSLTFSVMKKNPKNCDIEEFQLKPNGKQIQVTEENKEEYLKLYLQKYYEIGRQHELKQIATGFYSVVAAQYSSIFKPHELMQHLKGQQVCDVNVLRAHVKYAQGYTDTSVIIKWLWQVLQGYNQQQLNKFIQFLTGSPKLPIFNPNFQISIERVFDVKNLPVAHTCFNTLDLPQYPTKEILQKNLLTAIFEGNDNFGIM